MPPGSHWRFLRGRRRSLGATPASPGAEAEAARHLRAAQHAEGPCPGLGAAGPPLRAPACFPPTEVSLGTISRAAPPHHRRGWGRRHSPKSLNTPITPRPLSRPVRRIGQICPILCDSGRRAGNPPGHSSGQLPSPDTEGHRPQPQRGETQLMAAQRNPILLRPGAASPAANEVPLISSLIANS